MLNCHELSIIFYGTEYWETSSGMKMFQQMDAAANTIDGVCRQQRSEGKWKQKKTVEMSRTHNQEVWLGEFDT